MTRDRRGGDWEVYRIRAWSLAATVVQVAGFVLVFLGLWGFLGQHVFEYYERTGGVPESLVSVASSIPGLDQLTAILLFVAGAAIVWFSTT